MKKYFVIAFVLLSTITLSSNELSWVDAQVEAIKPPRKGMSSSNIANIKAPFIFLNKKKKAKVDSIHSSKTIKSTGPSGVVVKKPSKRLLLSAIINNSALINGKWYKLNDNVHSYKLSSINRTSAVLIQGKRKLILSTDSINQNIKFK